MPKGNPLAGIPAGTSEVYGVEMRRLQSVIDVIRDTYETFGFDPLHTPVLENAETFHGHHGEGEKLLFRFSDSGGNPLVNRYDLTVPLARFAASHPEVPRPFKRYQIAPVFRDDTPDLGHFREFTQCDGDTIGNSDPSSDAEVINVAYSGLSRLGFSDFTIRVNHRGIIKAIAEKAGVNDEQGVVTVQRALDFSDKVTKSGVAGIRSDLEEYGAPSPVISVITELLSLDFDDPLEKLSALESSLGFSATGRTALGELRVILEMLPANVLEKTFVDLTLARGADYYTGFILEGVINDVPVGVVIGGNMCSLNLLNGTEYFPSIVDDIILFIEDDSYDSMPEAFERNFQSIVQQPYFKQVKAILIGRFQNDSKSTEKAIKEIISSKRINHDIAIAYNLDFGHTDPKFTYPIGGKMRVDVTENSVRLKILQH